MIEGRPDVQESQRGIGMRGEWANQGNACTLRMINDFPKNTAATEDDMLSAGVAIASSPLLYSHTRRGVAQPGSVLAWGARGRVFESLRPDQ